MRTLRVPTSVLIEVWEPLRISLRSVVDLKKPLRSKIAIDYWVICWKLLLSNPGPLGTKSRMIPLNSETFCILHFAEWFTKPESSEFYSRRGHQFFVQICLERTKIDEKIVLFVFQKYLLSAKKTLTAFLYFPFYENAATKNILSSSSLHSHWPKRNNKTSSRDPFTRTFPS